MFHFAPGDISGLVCLTLMSVFLRLAFAWHMFSHSESTYVLVFQIVLSVLPNMKVPSVNLKFVNYLRLT